MISRINLRIRLRSCLYACVLILPFAVRAEESPPKPETLTLADLQGLVFTHDQVIRSFELEGQVCAVVPDPMMIVTFRQHHHRRRVALDFGRDVIKQLALGRCPTCGKLTFGCYECLTCRKKEQNNRAKRFR